MGKRRHFTPEFKTQVVLEVLSGEKTLPEACREYNLSPQLLGQWRRHFLAHAVEVFQPDKGQEEARARIAELERLVGRLTLELEVAKKAWHISTSRRGRSGR